MRNLIFCMLLCASFAQAQHRTASTVATRPVIGDVFNTGHQTAHPYNPTGQRGVIFEQEFYNKNSAYIKLYFENFDLGPEDYIEISTHNTGESIIYAGKGKIIDREGTTISNFWSKALLDERVTVRLHSGAPSNHYGFKISQVAYGYSAEEIEAIYNGKSICGTDDKQRIACYSGVRFTRGKAVCKLIIGGAGSCTGWLLGCEGHVMTNNHCISNSTQAANTDFLFDFQYSSCTGTGSLTANTVATSSTFIKTSPFSSSGLDYTLVKLPTNPTGTYGYLSLSPTAPAVGDRIYIIGHPGGRRKEITVNSDQDASGFATVNTLTTNGMRYYADTEGGSSGSPVLSHNSNLVYSIHNTGGCTNGSYGRCDKLIPHIGSDMPNGGVNYSGCGGGTSCGSTIASYPYTESFESGFGGWSNASGDDFDWTRRTGSTTSSNTGPSAAAVGSYYVYTESSSPNHPNKVAQLNSPCFNLSSIFSPSLSFRYHMYGSAMGTMRLQASTNGTSWTTLWTQSGDKGNSWRTATVSLNAYTSATQLRLRFVGTTGTSFTSDMAIDYIRITPTVVSSCNGNFPLTNSFELGWDSWTNDASGDDFNWTRQTGATSSTNTGPSSAANGSYYIYTESSSPNYGSKTAVVTSRCQNMLSLSNPAVTFSYHMYGSTMGTLQLQVRVGSGPWTTIWSRTGDQGNSWKTQYLNVNAYKSSNTSFRFRATTGSSFTSDMAVDNFRINNGLIIIDPPFDPLDPRIESDPLTDVVADPYLNVYPNPFNDQINIETNIEGLTSYRVTNLQGQVIQEANLQTNQILLTDLLPGVYFIMVYNGEEQHVRKIVKQ